MTLRCRRQSPARIRYECPVPTRLAARAARGHATVLTPHPLEAARLLAAPSADKVQANRLAAAQSLAQRFDCTVLLKGSGSVIAAPRRTPVINPTGNARLAGAGTGDVLAGWLGGLWSASAATGAMADAFVAARAVGIVAVQHLQVHVRVVEVADDGVAGGIELKR